MISLRNKKLVSQDPQPLQLSRHLKPSSSQLPRQEQGLEEAEEAFFSPNLGCQSPPARENPDHLEIGFQTPQREAVAESYVYVSWPFPNLSMRTWKWHEIINWKPGSCPKFGCRSSAHCRWLTQLWTTPQKNRRIDFTENCWFHM